MSSREWDLKDRRRFCMCWLLSLIHAHLTSELAFPCRRRARPWTQQSGYSNVIALHSPGIRQVQALSCDYGSQEQTVMVPELHSLSCNYGNQEQTVLVPELHSSSNSLPARPSTLRFACRAIWHGAWDVNFRGGNAVKCLNCSNSTTIWCKCLYGLGQNHTALESCMLWSTALMDWHKKTA